MAMREPTVQYANIPGRGWYAVAAAVMVAGIIAFVAFLTTRIYNLGGDFERVVAPTETDLRFEAGAYTIFHEQGGTANGVLISTGDISGMRIEIGAPGGGVAIPLTPNGSSRYSIGSRSGQSVFTFQISEPGTYRFRARYDDGRTSPEAVLMIGRDFLANLLKTIVGAIAIMFGAFAMAAAIAVVTYRKRRHRLGSAPIGG